MKFALMLSLLILIINCSSVSYTATNTCQCSLLNQSECLQLETCDWSNNACTTATLGTTYYSKCTSITSSATCITTSGCAYLNNKCVTFADCSSYSGTSNTECQAFSKACNYDPTNKICIQGVNSTICSLYTGEGNQTKCESVLYQMDTKYCKFDTTTNTCRQYQCTDFQGTTDDACSKLNKSLPNCVSDKVTCRSSLQPCKNYSTSDCLNVIGQEQSAASPTECELNSAKTGCQAKTCEGASLSTYTSDTCSSYLSGCKFNGINCVTTLAACTSYVKGENDTGDTWCTQYIDTIGNCRIDSDDNTKCVSNSCENYTATTDEACNTNLINCISNGVTCVTTLQDTCDKLKLTDYSTCNQYHTKEGKCKQDGSSDICALDSCSDQQLTTNAACSVYSSYPNSTLNCVTNGLKCVNPLITCEKIKVVTTDADNSTSVTDCTKIIGSNGKCKASSTEGATTCIVSDCTDATSPYSTTSCTQINTSCFYDGISCVSALKTCADYTTNCESIVTKDNSICVLNTTTSKCVVKSCETAPSTNTSDDSCNTYKTGCFTNGYGCVSSLKLCSTYTGVQADCEKYLGSDGKCTGTSTSGNCTPKVCSQATGTLSQAACQTYSPKCGYNYVNQKCNSYSTCQSLTTADTCYAGVTLENTAGICVYDSNSKCQSVACNAYSSGATTTICQAFGTTCQLNNQGCYDTTDFTCSTIKSRQLCTSDSSGNSCIWDIVNDNCFQFNNCEDYIFDANTTLTSAAQNTLCANLSSNCQSNGTKCVSVQVSTECSTKSEATCSGSTGLNNAICGYNSLTSVCQNFTACTDIVSANQNECQKYSTSCITDGTNCIAKSTCSTYSTETICNEGGTDGKCYWDSTNKKCSLWVCTDAIHTTYSECQTENASCTSNGTNCVSFTACSSYNSEDNCKQGIENNSTVTCIWKTANDTSSCSTKTCSDYTAISDESTCTTAGCAFNSTASACINIQACNAYDSEVTCSNLGKNSTQCIWSTTNSTSGCKEFSACTDAASDEELCNSKSNCYFIPSSTSGNTTIDSQCKTLDCYGANKYATSASGCKSYLSSDSKTLYYCGWNSTSSQCTDGDPTKLSQSNCFAYSAYTYHWSSSSSSCVICTTTTTNNSNSSNDSNTNDSQNSYVPLLIIGQLLILNIFS